MFLKWNEIRADASTVVQIRKIIHHDLNENGKCADMALVPTREVTMRIDLTGSLGIAGYESGSTTATKSPASALGRAAIAAPEDTASLSPRTLSLSSLASQVLDSAGARAAKVEAMRQAVARAEYNVDPALVAEAMINEGV